MPWVPVGEIAALAGGGLRIIIWGPGITGFIPPRDQDFIALSERDSSPIFTVAGSRIGALSRSPGGGGVRVTVAGVTCSGSWREFARLATGARGHPVTLSIQDVGSR